MVPAALQDWLHLPADRPDKLVVKCVLHRDPIDPEKQHNLLSSYTRLTSVTFGQIKMMKASLA
jgi:hypothetical protein